MRYQTMLEIIGTIAILATLFSSVGFSGWGSNLIVNGNFSEADPLNSSIPANWSLPDYIWGATDYVNGMLNISIDGQGYQTSPFELNNQTVYKMMLDYKMGGDFGLDAPTSNPIGIFNNNSWHSYYCDSFFFFFAFNRTDWGQWDAGCTGYPSLFNDSTYIEDLGDGWSRLHAYLDMRKSNISSVSDQFLIGMNTWYVLPVIFDNFELRAYEEETPLNLSIGYGEPVDGTRSMASPIVFSYAVLSNYDVLNCSLAVDSISEGGGFLIKQTNQTPVVTGGTLNYFQLSGLQTKDSFVWAVVCKTAYDPNTNYMGGNRTYLYDPMYAGDVATNILRLAPILLGLFVVCMTFVWVMNRESENFLSVMIQMAVLYMVLAVMLTIIFGIL